MKIWVCTVDFHRFIPDYRLHSQLWLPMKFYEGRFAACVNQAESVDTKPLHKSKRTRYRPVRHDPHCHVNALRSQRYKVPEVIVRSLCLREPPIRFLLCSMDQVRELDRILNKKDRYIVTHNVPVAFLGVQLNREATDIARKVRGSLIPGHG